MLIGLSGLSENQLKEIVKKIEEDKTKELIVPNKLPKKIEEKLIKEMKKIIDKERGNENE